MQTLNNTFNYFDNPVSKEFSLSEETFQQLREVIYANSGIFLRENYKQLLENRLTRRLKSLNCDSYETYLSHLQRDNVNHDEIRLLLDEVAITESDFFRNVSQLSALKAVVIPELLEQGRQRKNGLRILSAGCANGEEPFTLAIFLHEQFGLHQAKDQLTIEAIDISQKALEACRKAEYPQSVVKNVPGHYLQKYFYQENGKYGLAEEIQQIVNFKNCNLMETVSIRALGYFDIIFCCNVLLYFDTAAKVQVVQTMYDILNPGGYFFIGQSESLHGISGEFKLNLFNNAIAYKKE